VPDAPSHRTSIISDSRRIRRSTAWCARCPRSSPSFQAMGRVDLIGPDRFRTVPWRLSDISAVELSKRKLVRMIRIPADALHIATEVRLASRRGWACGTGFRFTTRVSHPFRGISARTNAHSGAARLRLVRCLRCRRRHHGRHRVTERQLTSRGLVRSGPGRAGCRSRSVQGATRRVDFCRGRSLSTWSCGRWRKTSARSSISTAGVESHGGGGPQLMVLRRK